MQLQSAIDFIKPALISRSGPERWADLGCGAGLFTSALSHFLIRGSIVYAIDTNAVALNKIETSTKVKVEKMIADFEKEKLPLSDLDGIIMANSLHYVADKQAFLFKAKNWIKKNGRLLLIEYDTDNGNRWVPFPLSFASAQALFKPPHYKSITKIGERSSLYNQAGMYAALIQF